MKSIIQAITSAFKATVHQASEQSGGEWIITESHGIEYVATVDIEQNQVIVNLRDNDGEPVKKFLVEFNVTEVK